jgi:hypothetical protein
MKEILADLGHLVAVKKLNPDHLTDGIGTNRQNLIAALKGRRHLPAAHLPSLRRVLGLDDRYRFIPDRVHGLTVNPGGNVAELLQGFQGMLRRFMSWPVRSKWLLRGIGEGSRSGFAYVFEDDRGALVAVRNDDALLGASHAPDAPNAKNAGNGHTSMNMAMAVMNVAADMAGLFSRTDGSPEREVALAAFEALFADDKGMSAEDLRVALTNTAAVWTWTKLRERAEQAGLGAESVARSIGLL